MAALKALLAPSTGAAPGRDRPGWRQDPEVLQPTRVWGSHLNWRGRTQI